MAEQRMHLIITGYVQGVFFRAHAETEARKHGVKGWVRNKGDGSVEVVAEGERKDLDRLREWCSQGPPLARITDMKVNFEPPTGEFKTFSIKY